MLSTEKMNVSCVINKMTFYVQLVIRYHCFNFRGALIKVYIYLRVIKTTYINI